MNELMEKFAAARFGKQAFFNLFGNIDPKKKAIRDKIEDMIREEQLKRDQAKEQITYGKRRIEDADKPSTLGWLSDISRSLIPGLSISADTAERMVKIAEGETPADKKWGGRLFDIAHLGAAGTGAIAGSAAQKGLLGDVGSTMRSLNKLDSKTIMGEISKGLKGMKGADQITRLAVKNPEIVALAAQRRIPLLTGLVEKVSPRYWINKLTGTPATQQAAQSKLKSMMRTGNGVTAGHVDDVLSQLRGLFPAAQRAGRQVSQKALKKAPMGGRAGALIGALALSAPFIGARLWKTRNLRASGGTAGQEAARKAEGLLSSAQQLRQQREELMRQLG